LGRLKQAEVELRPKNKRGLTEVQKAILRIDNSYLLAIRGQFTTAAFELNESIKILRRSNNIQGLIVALGYRAKLYLLMERYEEAFNASKEALKFWSRRSKNYAPTEFDYIRLNWLIGASLTWRASEATMNRDILLENAESYLNELYYTVVE
jgi:tetratricopeptide (TPR) repeat protein